MRESPAIPLIEGLLAAGARVQAHDPKAIDSARRIFGDRVMYAADPYSAAHGADALLVMTEWLVYRNPDFERIRKLLRRPLLIDGRNLYDPERMTDARLRVSRDRPGRAVTRVLVTGAAGFIGSHLVEALVAPGRRGAWASTTSIRSIPGHEGAEPGRDGPGRPGSRFHEQDMLDVDALRARLTPDDRDRPPRRQGRGATVAGRPGGLRPGQRHRHGGRARGGPAGRRVADRVRLVLLGVRRQHPGAVPGGCRGRGAGLARTRPPSGRASCSSSRSRRSTASGAPSLRFFTVYGPRQRPDLAIHSFARRMVGGRGHHPLRRRHPGARLHLLRRHRRGVVAALDWTAGAPVGVGDVQPGRQPVGADRRDGG